MLHEVREYMKPINEGKNKETYFKIKTVNGFIKVMNAARKYMPINDMNELERMHPN